MTKMLNKEGVPFERFQGSVTPGPGFVETFMATTEEFGLGSIFKTIEAEGRLRGRGLLPVFDSKTGSMTPFSDQQIQASKTFTDSFDLEKALITIENGDYSRAEKMKLLGSTSEVDYYRNLELIALTRRNFLSISNGSSYGLAGGFGLMMVTDPLNFAAPVAVVSKMNKIRKVLQFHNTRNFALGGAAIATVEDQLIRANSPGNEPSITASMINIGAVTAITGGIGHLFDRKALKDMQFADKVRGSLHVPDKTPKIKVRARFDAHPAAAYGAEKLATLTSPLVRLMSSPSKFIRNFAHELMETPFITSDNLKGVASPEALESKIRNDGWLDHNVFLEGIEDGYLRYLTRAHTGGVQGGGTIRRRYMSLLNKVAGNPSGSMTFKEFDKMVAMVRAGAIKSTDDVPEQVLEIAENLDKFFKKWEPRASRWWKPEAGVTGVPRSVNYLNRRYDFTAIEKNKEGFVNFVFRQFMRNTEGSSSLTPAQLGSEQALIRKTVDKMTRSAEERIVLEDIFDEVQRDSMLSRYWDFIDDADLYKTDFVHISATDAVKNYSRSTITDTLFAEHYGTLSMKKITDKLRRSALEEFEGLDANELKILEKELELSTAMLERVRGTHMDPHAPTPGGLVYRAIDSALKFNNLRTGGGFMLASFPDIARPAMHVGIVKAYGPRLKAFLLRNREIKEALGVANQEMRAMNLGNELYFSQRISSMTDALPGASDASRFEKWLNEANDAFFQVNGLTLWNQYMKRTTGVVIVDKIISAAEDLAKGTISKDRLSSLAQMGLDERDLTRILKEFSEHGRTVQGVRITDYTNWSTGSRPVLNRFIAAIKKEVDTLIVTPGVGDTPLLLSNAYFKVIAQYKTFALAATNRMMVRGLQQPDTNLQTGMLISIVAGAAVQDYRDMQNGKEFNFNDTISSGIDRSGFLASIAVANEAITQTPFGNFAITGNKEPHRFNAYGLGPTASGITDVSTVLGDIASGEVSKAGRKAAWNLTPFHNATLVELTLNPLWDQSGNTEVQDAIDYYSKGGGKYRPSEENTYGFGGHFE